MARGLVCTAGLVFVSPRFCEYGYVTHSACDRRQSASWLGWHYAGVHMRVLVLDKGPGLRWGRIKKGPESEGE